MFLGGVYNSMSLGGVQTSRSTQCYVPMRGIGYYVPMKWQVAMLLGGVHTAMFPRYILFPEKDTNFSVFFNFNDC